MKNSREHHSLAFVRITISLFFQNSILLPFLGPVISLVPTLYGCESVSAPDCDFVVAGASATTKVAVLGTEVTRVETMDVLVFNDDELQRLDCYQRMEGMNEETFMVSSQKGEKIIMLCANSQHGAEDWMWLSSLSGLYKTSASLEKESREAPVMSGMIYGTAGGVYEPILRRLSAEVVLRSIRCDFTDKPYDGEPLDNILVYLTNVNAETYIWEGEGRTQRFINQGRFNEDDMGHFVDRSLVYAEVDEPVGKTVLNTDIRFRCYPNFSSKEGPGNPFTRLVVQADIQGITWYWPIAVKSGTLTEGEDGVYGNRTYTYDICITGKGSADPDTEIEKGNIQIKTEIKGWIEKEEYDVIF